MDIECLIRELIMEDRFNEKYTKNQRSIFRKNMYEKVAQFIKENEKEKCFLQNKLDIYRNAYEELVKKNRRESCMELLFSLMLFLSIIYIYYNIINYANTHFS